MAIYDLNSFERSLLYACCCRPLTFLMTRFASVHSNRRVAQEEAGSQHVRHLHRESTSSGLARRVACGSAVMPTSVRVFARCVDTHLTHFFYFFWLFENCDISPSLELVLHQPTTASTNFASVDGAWLAKSKRARIARKRWISSKCSATHGRSKIFCTETSSMSSATCWYGSRSS